MAPEEFPESDWKLVKKAYETGLERFCMTALQEAVAIPKNESLSAPERFRSLYGHMKSMNKELGGIFDDNYRRSRAMHLLFMLRARDLIDAEELRKFSQGTRDRIEGMMKIYE